MRSRFQTLVSALALLAALWGLGLVNQSDGGSWLAPAGSPPAPVRILRFYANVGEITEGQKAQLCYGVENAKSVRIAPPVEDVYPSAQHCVVVVPAHTTHYTILAEGYDGRVAMRSVTLPVETLPAAPQPEWNYAGVRGAGAFRRSL